MSCASQILRVLLVTGLRLAVVFFVWLEEEEIYMTKRERGLFQVSGGRIRPLAVHGVPSRIRSPTALSQIEASLFRDPVFPSSPGCTIS